MKAIIIEEVTNGWIVRPWEALNPATVDTRQGIWVFSSMDSLTAKLPSLLEDLRGKERLTNPRPQE